MGAWVPSIDGVAGAVRAALGTPRRVLVALSSNSLLFRAVPEALAPLSRWAVDGLADSALVSIALAVLAVRESGVTLVAAGFDWLLLAYVVYRFFPQLLPEGAQTDRAVDRGGFRLLVTVVVCSLAVPFADQAPTLFGPSVLPAAVEAALTDGRTLFVVFACWLLGSALLVGGYVHLTWWREASVADRAALIDQLGPNAMESDDRSDVREDLKRDDWVGTASNAVGLLACVLVLVVLCAFLALLAGFVGVLFPLPQILVLVGATAAFVGTPLPDDAVGTSLRERAIDVETRFYRLLRFIATSRKGMLVAPFFVAGILVSIVLTLLSFVAVAILGYLAVVRPEVFFDGRISPITRWNIVGYLVSVAAPGLYSLWFWVRETERLPQYLKHWEQSHPGSASVATESLPDPVTRPPGGLVVPTVFVGLFFVFVRIARAETTPFVPNLAFAFAWPLALAVTVWSLRWTYRNPPQHPRTESYALPVAFLLQLLWVWILFGAISPGLFSAWRLLVVAFAAFVLYVAPDVTVRIESATDSDRIAVSVGAFLPGSVFVLVGAGLWVADIETWSVLAAAGVVLLCVGVVSFVLLTLYERSD